LVFDVLGTTNIKHHTVDMASTRENEGIRDLVRVLGDLGLAVDADLEWPVVNHVIAALDLAQDQGRGREALAQWDPKGLARVW
jgi:hypothetical protein